MKKIITILFTISLCYHTNAQVISILDPIFEQVLINQEIDTDEIVNGQITTADALVVTTLSITSPDISSGEHINDLTGIEGFTNLESLTVNFTMIEELNVSTLVNLKHLDCQDNMLSTLDVSNNSVLEHLNISSGGDVYPFNEITEIDLSNNPNIKTLLAKGAMNYINLKNGNNNPDMHIDISAFYVGGPPPDGHTCIEVDDATTAQNNQFPYSEWTIQHSYQTYSFVANCSLSTEEFNNKLISVYPNPTSDILNFKTTDGTEIEKAILFDVSGRVVKEYNDISDYVSVADLQAGTYILKLVSGKETFTQKTIKK